MAWFDVRTVPGEQSGFGYVSGGAFLKGAEYVTKGRDKQPAQLRDVR